MSTVRCTPASTRTISRRRHNETHSCEHQRTQTQNDKKYIFTDVLHNGCCSGVVSELIYYYDTVRFYKQYRQEINEMLYNIMNETGLYAPSELFGDKWDKEDPLAQDDFNQNLLAWFGFEETLRNIGYNFETLENYI